MKKPLLTGLIAVTFLILVLIFFRQMLGTDAYCTALLRQASDTSATTSSDVQERATRLLEESYQQCKATLKDVALNQQGVLRDNALFLIAYRDESPGRIDVFIKVLQDMKVEEKTLINCPY